MRKNPACNVVVQYIDQLCQLTKTEPLERSNQSSHAEAILGTQKMLVNRSFSTEFEKVGKTKKDKAILRDTKSAKTDRKRPKLDSRVPFSEVLCTPIRPIRSTIGSLRQMVITTTGLTTEQKELLAGALKICANSQCIVKISPNFNESVTHVVTNCNAKGLCSRTLKYLMGLVQGKWILSFRWVLESVSQESWMQENAYEAKGDTVNGATDSPFKARMLKYDTAGFFKENTFVLRGKFSKPSKHDLILLLKYCGAQTATGNGNPEKLTWIVREVLLPSESSSNTITVKHLLDSISRLSPLNIK